MDKYALAYQFELDCYRFEPCLLPSHCREDLVADPPGPTRFGQYQRLSISLRLSQSFLPLSDCAECHELE